MRQSPGEIVLLRLMSADHGQADQAASGAKCTNKSPKLLVTSGGHLLDV